LFRRFFCFFSSEPVARLQLAGDGLQEAMQAGWLPETLLKSLTESAGGLDGPAVGGGAGEGTQSPDWLSRFYAHQTC